ncbi:transposase [Rhodovulum sulfidophilum]|uniref:Transposase n=1 Tax=Rhodovulum sulfidophilum TaxID=35806 RepID=A0A0D6B5E3_RHOSU|nr:transposase [Rhodovulum sulfidophilum]
MRKEELPMRKTGFPNARIIGILRQLEPGPVAEQSREHGMSRATADKWRCSERGLMATFRCHAVHRPDLGQFQPPPFQQWPERTKNAAPRRQPPLDIEYPDPAISKKGNRANLPAAFSPLLFGIAKPRNE